MLDAVRTGPVTAAPAEPGASQPIVAGLVAAVVGFSSSIVVLAGLHAVGASRAEAASGLLVLSVGMGVLGIAMSLITRMPISVAWSTPGAALLVSAGPVHGGYAAAIGAFCLAAALTIAAGLLKPFERLIAAIPSPITSALLAGVLLQVCIAPVQAVVQIPGQAAPVIIVWALLMRFARRWAVPGALVAAGAAIAIAGSLHGGATAHPWPTLVATTPSFDLATLFGVGLPLFVVTMATQNLTGMSVLQMHGYEPPLRPVLLSTGVASAAAAPLGGHGINLAAITAAMAAGPDAHPNPKRRWIAAVTAGSAYVVLGLSAGLVTALIAASPQVLIEAVAGLALIGALGAALSAAMADDDSRDAAVITFVVSASGITALGVSGPFWGLTAGLAFLALQRLRPSA